MIKYIVGYIVTKFLYVSYSLSTHDIMTLLMGHLKLLSIELSTQKFARVQVIHMYMHPLVPCSAD